VIKTPSGQLITDIIESWREEGKGIQPFTNIDNLIEDIVGK
jgi:hypothetical protein